MDSLSQEIVIELCRCWEDGFTPYQSQHGNIVRGVIASDLSGSLGGLFCTSWFKTVAYSAIYPIQSFSGREFVNVRYHRKAGGYYYNCPDTLRMVLLAKESLAIRVLNEAKLFTWLTDRLGVKTPLPVAEPSCHGVLQLLGTAQLSPGFSYPVWLCRKNLTHLDILDAYLRQQVGRQKGILLLCGDRLPPHYQLPDGFYSVPLSDVIIEVGQQVRIDKQVLYDVVAHTGFSTRQHPVRYDAVERELTIVGKEPWRLKGDNQAALVEYLYQQSLTGRWEVRASDMIKAVKLRTAKSEHWSVRRVPELFGANSHWREYLVSRHKGCYSFNLD